MGKYLSDAQISRYREEGFLVVPDFVEPLRCMELRQRAMELARGHVPPPARAMG